MLFYQRFRAGTITAAPSKATMEHKDPLDFLMNAGHDPEMWAMIGLPLGLLVLVAIIATAFITVRRRQERRRLIADVESVGLNQDDSKRDLKTRAQPKLVVVPAPSSTEEPQASLPDDVADVRRTDRQSWLQRLAQGLSKSRESFRASVQSIFTGKVKIDTSTLEKLHEALYRADIGVATADKLVDEVRKTLGKEESADWDAVARCLKSEAQRLLEKPTKPLNTPAQGPWVILVVGVNGVGKTTTIGKLGAHFLAQDKKVLLAAGDTFRAAAIEQLEIWGKRLGVDVIRHKQGSDPAAVAYDAVKAAIARKVDILIIDTAGRLHSKSELMDELSKVTRVIGKDLPGAPHETWLVIDATTGQNAVHQVKAFREVSGVTGLVVTKLDGTAKGGVLIGIADQFNLPIRYVGVGEKAQDLRDFNPADFVESLF